MSTENMTKIEDHNGVGVLWTFSLGGLSIDRQESFKGWK